MLVETENLVPAAEFRRDLDKYLAAAQQGNGPIVVTQDLKIVGIFVGPQEYEAMVGSAVRRLLKSREKGPTMSHEEVRASLKKTLRRRPRRS